MANTSLHFTSNHVVKMFPVSFERVGKYDRVLSEENLVDWIRGIASNSANPEKNSACSYVITEKLDGNFGKTRNDTTIEYHIEFLIGGYYVKLSDVGFMDKSFGNCDIYAVIRESVDPDCFRCLTGESINSDDNEFTALQIVSCGIGEELTLESESLGTPHKLHILTKTGDSFSIPPDSLRVTSAIDGGEIL